MHSLPGVRAAKAMLSRVSHFASCLPGPSVGKGAGSAQFSSVYSSPLGNRCPGNIALNSSKRRNGKKTV